jgi:hypothetical protein
MLTFIYSILEVNKVWTSSNSCERRAVTPALQHAPPTACKYLVGTMCDVPPGDRQVDRTRAQLLADEFQVGRPAAPPPAPQHPPQMKFFETSAKLNINVHEMFMSLATDMHTVLHGGGVLPAVSRLVCSSRSFVASSICPRVPFPRPPAYAHVTAEVAARGAAFEPTFAAACVPVHGLANAVRVPVLSPEQWRRLICSCGHVRHFFNCAMPAKLRHATDPRHTLLLMLFGCAAVSQILAAGSHDKTKAVTGGAMVTARQLQPSDAAWQCDSSSSACACCNSHFTWFNRRHHCRFSLIS